MNDLEKAEQETMKELKKVVKEEFLKIAEAKGWKPIEEEAQKNE